MKPTKVTRSSRPWRGSQPTFRIFNKKNHKLTFQDSMRNTIKDARLFRPSNWQNHNTWTYKTKNLWMFYNSSPISMMIRNIKVALRKLLRCSLSFRIWNKNAMKMMIAIWLTMMICKDFKFSFTILRMSTVYSKPISKICYQKLSSSCTNTQGLKIVQKYWNKKPKNLYKNLRTLTNPIKRLSTR
jgi:hypothetical protein